MEKINSFPIMKKKDVSKILSKRNEKNKNNLNNSVGQIDLEVKNPLEESKHSIKGIKQDKINQDDSKQISKSK